MISSTLRRTAVAVALATATAGLVGSAATAAEPTPTSLSIRAVKSAVRPGGTTTIAGSLVVASGLSRAGKPVTLEAKEAGEDVFTPIGVAVTGDLGGVRLKVTPAVTTRYRWDFAGDAANRPSVSGVVRVRVRTPEHPPLRLPTSLSIRARTPRVALDGTYLVTGRLRSRGFPLVHKWVLLLSKDDGTTKWAFDGAKRTRRLGQVRFVVSPTVGTSYRLAFLGTPSFQPARSAVVHVAARPNALTIDASPAYIDAGSSATVSGVLTHLGAPFAGQTVQLRSKLVGSDDPFAVVDSGVTAADGSVSFTVTPAAATRYVLFLPFSAGVPAAKSPVATVWIKLATSLSIRGKVTARGYVVSGDLRGHGMALAGRLVTLQSMAGGDTTWADVKTKRTDLQGRVRFVQPVAPGTSYRLSYAGGARFAPCTSGIVVQ